MALLDESDLAYMRATQEEAQPTVATLLRQGAPTRDALGGRAPAPTVDGDAGRSTFVVGPPNAGPGSWYGDCYVVYVPVTASANITVAQADLTFTLDGGPPPANTMYVNAWLPGDEPTPPGAPYVPGTNPVVGGGLGNPGDTLTLEAGQSYVLGFQVYVHDPDDYEGMVANFDAVAGLLEGTGEAITLRIDNDPRPPEPLATEFGIHLVRLTIPEGVHLDTGDTIKVSSTEEYRVVSNGDTDPWTTAQRLWAVRVVHGGA